MACQFDQPRAIGAQRVFEPREARLLGVRAPTPMTVERRHVLDVAVLSDPQFLELAELHERAAQISMAVCVVVGVKMRRPAPCQRVETRNLPLELFAADRFSTTGIG